MVHQEAKAGVWGSITSTDQSGERMGAFMLTCSAPFPKDIPGPAYKVVQHTFGVSLPISINTMKNIPHRHAHSQSDLGTCPLRHSWPVILNCGKMTTRTDHQTSSGPEFHIPLVYRIKLIWAKLPTHEFWWNTRSTAVSALLMWLGPQTSHL